MRALQQQQLEDLVALLRGAQPFAGFTREQLTSLAIFVRPVEVPKDQVIVKQGDAVDAFYLIKSGLCSCAARYNTGLLIKVTPRCVGFSFLAFQVCAIAKAP